MPRDLYCPADPSWNFGGTCAFQGSWSMRAVDPMCAPGRRPEAASPLPLSQLQVQVPGYPHCSATWRARPTSRWPLVTPQLQHPGPAYPQTHRNSHPGTTGEPPTMDPMTNLRFLNQLELLLQCGNPSPNFGPELGPPSTLPSTAATLGPPCCLCRVTVVCS